MNKETFSFELLDKYPPETIIRNSLKQIEEATRGYVRGNIEEYDGPIHSYAKKAGEQPKLLVQKSRVILNSEAFQFPEEERGDIQEKLGALDNEKHRYEVFLTAKGLEHYRYRMMFVDYGTVSYPVQIVLNETLAVAYSGKRTDTFYIDSMMKMEELMEAVINCDAIVALIQSLINESMRQEAKERVL